MIGTQNIFPWRFFKKWFKNSDIWLKYSREFYHIPLWKKNHFLSLFQKQQWLKNLVLMKIFKPLIKDSHSWLNLQFPKTYILKLYKNYTLFIFYKNLVYKNIKPWNCSKIKNFVAILLVAISISFEGLGKNRTFL